MAGDVSIEVKGISQALKNLRTMGDKITTSVTRKAVRAATKLIADAIKADTYKSPRDEITGLLKRSQGISVGSRQGIVRGKVKMRDVNVGSPKAKFARNFRATAARSRRSAAAYSAFYWLFLEKGTNERKTTKGADRGRVPKQPWIEPAFDRTNNAALSAFQRIFTGETEAAARGLPKGAGR